MVGMDRIVLPCRLVYEKVGRIDRSLLASDLTERSLFV
jgi:hypothetical protein